MNTLWQKQLDQIVDSRFEQLVDMRRHLHMNPEPSGKEQETSLYLYQKLDDEGFEVRMGPEGRGVLADMPASNRQAEQRLVALRGDIDGLFIHDAKQVAYRSRREGLMHGCGHDGHTAVIFGAISAVQELHKSGDAPWPIAVRGIFQPAEETVTGAKEMIGVGALDGVQAIMACHVDPTLPVGRIGVRSGVLTASCDQVDFTIVGRGGHAARPHETSDPIAAAAQLINSLYLFIPRVTDSQDAVVVTIGTVSGGVNANVIPETVTLGGTVRTLDPEVRRETFEHIERLSSGISETTGTEIQVSFGQGCGSIDNDVSLIDLFSRAAREVLGPDGVAVIPRASMGSEDFAFYLERVPGAMFRLGCKSQRAGGAALHSPFFDIDEEALRIGAKILARAAVYRSCPEV
jgi:amidohydrolase